MLLLKKQKKLLGADIVNKKKRLIISMVCIKQVIKEETTSPSQAFFSFGNQMSNKPFFVQMKIQVFNTHTKGPPSVKTSELYSVAPKFEIVRKVFQVLSE